LKGAFEIEPVEEIAKAGVEHNQHQRDLKEKEQQDVKTVELKKLW